MKLLSLNCQRGYHQGLRKFLRETLESGEYDFLLLQEFAKGVPSYIHDIGGYGLLRLYNDEINEESQTVIMYRKKHRLLGHSMIHFPKTYPDPVMGRKHSTFGSLCARFEIGSGIVLLGSIHLHSGMGRSVRLIQTQKVKKQVLDLRRKDDQVIFGGDCNFGYPSERRRAESMMAPEFVCVTKDLGPTLDSRYSENVPHIMNRIAVFLSLFGIGIPLWTDQLFVDTKTAQESIVCRVLADRVSDHSPLELVWSK